MASKSQNNSQNVRKAALVLLSLAHRQRCELLDKLEASQADAVVAEMNAIDIHVAAAEQEAAVREFTGANFPAAGKSKCKGKEKSSPFQFLHELDGKKLRNLIAGEQPQTIALVLANLPPRQAAAALAELEPEEQFMVACRIAAAGDATPEAVCDLADGLKRRLHTATNRRPGAGRGISTLVRILNAMPPAVERRLLGDMAESEPELSQRIRQKMFGPEIAAHHEWAVAEIAC